MATKRKTAVDLEKLRELSERWLMRLRNMPIVAAIIVLGTGVTYVSGLWGTLPEQMRQYFVSLFQNSIKLPGDTGWIFVGYYRTDIDNFTEGPKIEVIKSAFRVRAQYVEIGDTVRVKTARPVVIPNFRTLGTSQKLASPVGQGVISNNDMTGITLPAGTELIVRDVSKGAFPGNPSQAIWARIALPD